MSPNTKDYKLLIEEENATIPSQPSLIAVKDNFSYISSLATTGIFPILTYCVASILMTVTNKYVLSGYEFNMNFLLLGVQSISCVVLLYIFKIFKLVTYRKLDSEISQKWFPVAAMLVAMIYTGSKSLQYLSIPVYTIFKNLTIILIAYGEVIWFEGSITRLTMSSFLLMVLSSIIAAWSDISTVFSDAPYASLDLGYFWMCFNCISSAAYVLTMRKYIKSIEFKDFDTVYYNNFLSIPLLIILSFMMEDWSAKNLEKNFPVEVRSTLVMAILFSGISAFAISYASAWCVRVTSSTTYSMVGALNKLPVAASGMIFFDDPVNVGSVSSITVGFIAGVLYSIAKSAQAKPTKQNGDDLPKPVSSQLKKC